MLWKAHHSFCDGISVMCMTLALSEEYDKSYFIKAEDASWLESIGIRLMIPFYLPKIMMQTFFDWADTNILMRNKDRLTGVMNVSSSGSIPLDEVKALSKKLKMTINDVILCALTTSVGKLFKEKGDKSS